MTGILNALLGFINSAAQALDPFFNQVVLLLHGDGTNGAQNNTFLDGSTNNFTITRNGNTTQGTFSPFSVGAGEFSNYFDGSGDGLSLSGNAAFDFGSGDFTVEALVYLTGNSPLDGSSRRIANIFSVSTSSVFNFNFIIRGDGTTTGTGLEIYNGTNIVNVTGTINQNTWNHIAVSKSGTSVYFWLNGTQMGSTQTTSGNWGSSANGAQVGRALAINYTSDLNGYMSNVRVVKGTAVYTSAFTPSTTPLTAISNTSLLTCQSNRFVDNSSNAFAITRNGDVRVTPFSPFAPTAAYSASTNGGSGYFDGTGDYLSTPSISLGTNNFTFETWLYRTATGANEAVFVAQSNGSFSIGFESSGGVIQISRVNIAYITQISTTVPLNQWFHLAVSKSSNVYRVFVNGTQVGSNATDSTSLGASLYNIGVNSANASPFTGYFSNLRLIIGTALYTSNFTPPTAPLTAITNTSLLLNFTNAGIFDNTGKNNLETVGNAQIDTGTKKYGTGSMEFDGTGDWLLIPNSPDIQLGTGNFTIEFWIYLNAISAARGFVAKGGASTGWLVSLVSTNTVRFTFTTSTITSTGTLAASTWYHIAVVREGTGSNQTKIYINGTNDGTGTVSTDFNQTESMYVGANRTGGDALNGFIDDLRITKGIARYTANFTPPTSAFSDK
jgi:hypothetical protein